MATANGPQGLKALIQPKSTPQSRIWVLWSKGWKLFFIQALSCGSANSRCL